MTLKITMAADERLELGVGKVTPGREGWMYGEYFPAIGPVMAEHGQRNLGPFAVIATNLDGDAPVQGSLTAWPSADARARFFDDPRFVAVHQERDDALDVLDDGHLFAPLTGEVSIDTEVEHALVVTSDDGSHTDALLRTPLTEDSANQQHAGKTLFLAPWSEAAEQLMRKSAAEATVFRIRFR